MIGSLVLAWRQVTHRWGRSLVLALALAVTLALPVGGSAAVSIFNRQLHARAEGVDLLVGPKGSRFELVFAALYHRRGSGGTFPMRVYERLLDEDRVNAVPLNTRFTAQGAPVVAGSIELFEERSLAVDRGRLFAGLGDAVVGSRAAGRLGLTVGDPLVSDQRSSYDLTAAPSIELRVSGILEPSGTVDDDAVFVDLETCWLLEGKAHAHASPETITDPDLVIGRSDTAVALSGAVVTDRVITADNLRGVHVHGDRGDLPLTAVIVTTRDDRERTILMARLNREPETMAVVPTEVVDELLGYVLRVKAVFDAVAVLLAVVTVVLAGLIVALTLQAREDELRTLSRVGASPVSLALMIVFELAVVAAGAVVIAAGLVGATVFAAEQWWPMLS